MALIRDRYELLETIGRGGQGEVIKALDRQHDRVVALKVREIGSESERAALLGEARVLLSLTPSQNLPLVREDFFEGDRYYLAMDWIDGPNLEQVVADEGSPGLPIDQTADYLEQTAAALTHLHSHKPPVVHQDVKPANIIRTEEDRLVLVDFGIASRGKSGTDRPKGTSGFTAPEVLAGAHPTPSADVFGLASTAFVLMTGRQPSAAAIAGIPRRLPKPEKRALRVVRRGLSIDPGRRPTTAAGFMKAFRDAVAGRIDYQRATRRVAALVAVGLAVTALVVWFLGNLAQSKRDNATPPPKPTLQATRTKPPSPSPKPSKSTSTPSPSPPPPTPTTTEVLWDDFQTAAQIGIADPDYPPDSSEVWVTEGTARMNKEIAGDSGDVFNQAVTWRKIFRPADWKPATKVRVEFSYQYSLTTDGNLEADLEKVVYAEAGIKLIGKGCDTDIDGLRGTRLPDSSVWSKHSLIVTCDFASDAEELRVDVSTSGVITTTDPPERDRSIELSFRPLRVSIVFS